jgi:hypothetical protein
MGGEAFPIERGFLGCVQGTPHGSHLSVTCLKVRGSPGGGAGGKKYAGRRNVPQSRLLAGSRVDPETKRNENMHGM